MYPVEFALVTALKIEAGLFLNKLKHPRRLDHGIRLGEIAGRSVAIIATGVGMKRAAKQTRLFLNLVQPARLLCCGFGGGTLASQKTGDLVAGKRLFQETGNGDFLDVSALLDSDLGQTLFGSASNGLEVVFNGIATCSKPVLKASRKTALGAQYPIGAVDMESVAVLEAAASAGVVGACLRSITDTTDETLPDGVQDIIDKEGQPSVRMAAGHLAMHPNQIPGVLHLRKRAKIAGGTLTQAVVKWLEDF